jgi:hypothetical protein
MDSKNASRILRLGVGGLLIWTGIGRLLYPDPFLVIAGSCWAGLGTPASAYAFGFLEAMAGLFLVTNLATPSALRFCRVLSLAPLGLVVALPSLSLVGGPLPILSVTGQGMVAYAVLLFVASVVATPRATADVRGALDREASEGEPLFAPGRS